MVKLNSCPILHPKLVPVLKMNLFPPDFFQTGLFGAAEALSLESSYNPPSEFDVSPVT